MKLLSRLVRWFVREANAGRADADLRAKLWYDYEHKLYTAAWKWVQETPVCPSCKTDNGLIAWVQDGMEVRGNYCHDPHLWHAAKNYPHDHMRYGDVVWQDALVKIGQRIHRGRL